MTFYNEDVKKEVKLNSRFLVLHYKKGAYVGFKEFLNDVNMILISINKRYTPLKINFMGLRYINQINEEVITEDNIKEYINPSLTDNIIFDLEDGENLSQILSRLDLIKDDYNLTFQYGFFNPGFPNPKFKKDFILDFDCKVVDINLIKSQEGIVSELKKMNDIVYNKFKYSTTEKLREDVMKVIK